MAEPTPCRIVSVTDTGRKRRHNEDFILADEGLRLCVVADGMGGHLHGEVASRMASETILEHFKTRARSVDPEQTDPNEEVEFLRYAVQKANSAVFHKGDEDSDFNDMGTTIVAIAIRAGHAIVANVGDSRLYRWRAGRLRQLTHDHSWVGEMWEKKLISKDAAMVHPERNVVTRALGVEAEVEVDVEKHGIRGGDLFLLCSDGLSDMVDDATISDVMEKAAGNLEQIGNTLVRLANERGGDDNISVALVLV